MKLWLKRTVIGVFGTTLLVGGLSACSQRHHGDSWSTERVAEVRGRMVEKISGKLDLDPVQRQKLATLADEMVASRAAMRGGDAAAPRSEFLALMGTDKFDRGRAQSLLDQKTHAVQNQGPKLIAAMADFYDSLSPEQQKKLRGRMEHRGGWWGRG